MSQYQKQFQADFFNYKKDVDKQLKHFFHQAQDKYGNLDPEIGSIIKLLSNQVLRGGKRLRARLTQLGYMAVGGKDQDNVLQASIVPELIHQFILMHDDILDEDDLRYGKPTLHKVYEDSLGPEKANKSLDHGKALAMGAADMLFFMTEEYLFSLDIDPQKLISAQRVLSRYITQTVAGWALQIRHIHEPLDQISITDYIRATSLVTAHYTAEGPLLFGVSLHEPPDYNSPIANYGQHIGLAFQLQDDVIGMFGDSKKTGKPVGNDFREGKRTELLMIAHDKANPKQKTLLQNHLGKSVDENIIQEVQEIMESTGALKSIKKRAQTEAETALKILNGMKQEKYNPIAIKELKTFTKFIVNRSF